MVEIMRHRVGTCDSCNQKTAEYSIRGGPGEWEGLNKLCQLCMLNLLRANELIRNVLLLQGGTND